MGTKTSVFSFNDYIFDQYRNAYKDCDRDPRGILPEGL